jgi:hypothetical protein
MNDASRIAHTMSQHVRPLGCLDAMRLLAPRLADHIARAPRSAAWNDFAQQIWSARDDVGQA